MKYSKGFVPDILINTIRNEVVQQGKDYMEPFSFFVHGVCLIVDISGFTRLSGEYCSMGKAGLDQLQLATNGYMGKLVEIISQSGGEIIKFAGDAIICLFPGSAQSTRRVFRSGSNASEFSELCSVVSGAVQSMGASSIATGVENTSNAIPSETLLRAMFCAHELRDVQTEKLTVHMALSCGEVCFGILGGCENQWEYLISGPCIHQLSACLDEAPSKTIVMTNQCADILLANVHSSPTAGGIIRSAARTPTGAYNFSVKQLSSGNMRVDSVWFNSAESVQNGDAVVSAKANLDVPDKVIRVLRLFIPQPIAHQLVTRTGLQFLAEIREVSTMFMKVSFS